MRLVTKVAFFAAVVFSLAGAANASEPSYIGENPYSASFAVPSSATEVSSVGAQPSDAMDFYKFMEDQKTDVAHNCFMIYCLSPDNPDGWDWIWNMS